MSGRIGSCWTTGGRPRPRALAAALLLAAVAIAVPRSIQAGEPLLERAAEANRLARDWLAGNLKESGLFLYSLDAATGLEPDRNNALRQLMASRTLAEESRENPERRPLHQRNLDFLFAHWYREEGSIGYIYFEENSKLGANAMALRTLVVSPFHGRYEGPARALADGILSLQQEDGSFDPWYVAPRRPYDEDRLLVFYSGEAILALVEYFQLSGDRKYLASAERAAGFYIAKYVDQIERNYHPAYVPWNTMAFSGLFKITGDRKYVKAINVLNDRLLELQDTTRFVGRFYQAKTRRYGTPHSASDGVYTEGLAYACEIADITKDRVRRARYRRALEMAVGNIVSLQLREPRPGWSADPARYRGAIREQALSARIRLDTTQHGIDALTRALEVLNKP